MMKRKEKIKPKIDEPVKAEPHNTGAVEESLDSVNTILEELKRNIKMMRMQTEILMRAARQLNAESRSTGAGEEDYKVEF
jgi:hypothetical protein